MSRSNATYNDVVYTNGQAQWQHDGVVTLYAGWAPIEVDITMSAGVEGWTAPSSVKATFASGNISFGSTYTAPTKAGYTLKGWSAGDSTGAVINADGTLATHTEANAS